VIAATGVVCVGFVAAEAFPAALIHAFARDPALVVVGVRGMRICLLMAPVVGFQIVSAHFFQAIGKARRALVLTLLRQIFILIPLLVVLPRHLGLDGVWGAGPIADLASSLITALLLAGQLRQLRAETAAPGA
jgi:Na+-driven multidrug efflux pump